KGWAILLRQKQKKLIMLPSETMIWQPEFTDKTLSRKPGAVQEVYRDDQSLQRIVVQENNHIKPCQEYHPGPYIITCLFDCCCSPSPLKELEMVLVECFSQVYVSWYSECPTCPQAYQYLNNSFEPPYKTPSCCWGYPDYTDFLSLGNDGNHLA
ncbi:hypothetical protein, partial [Escherichia coli]